jgi:hypothetical protein
VGVWVCVCVGGWMCVCAVVLGWRSNTFVPNVLDILLCLAFFYLALKVIGERDIFRGTELILLNIVPYQMINCQEGIFHLTVILKSW